MLQVQMPFLHIDAAVCDRCAVCLLQCASDDSKLYMRRLEAKVSELRDQADLGAKHAKATKQVQLQQSPLLQDAYYCSVRPQVVFGSFLCRVTSCVHATERQLLNVNCGYGELQWVGLAHSEYSPCGLVAWTMSQVASLQARLAAAEAELAACEDVNQERAREVTRLQQALQIRAKELSSKGGGDVQAQLLYALAGEHGTRIKVSGHYAALVSRCQVAWYF